MTAIAAAVTASAAAQLDPVDEWLADQVAAGRLELPLPTETLARIASITLRAPSHDRKTIAPAARPRRSKEAAHGAYPTARREL
jgi:hypothetical protein